MKFLFLNIWHLLFTSQPGTTIAKYSFNDTKVVNQIALEAHQVPVDENVLFKEIMDLLNQQTNQVDSAVLLSHRVHHISPFGIRPLGRVYYHFSLRVNKNQLEYELSNFLWKDIKRNRYGRFIETIRGRKKDLKLFDKRLSSAQKLSITNRINHELRRIHQHLTNRLKVS